LRKRRRGCPPSLRRKATTEKKRILNNYIQNTRRRKRKCGGLLKREKTKKKRTARHRIGKSAISSVLWGKILEKVLLSLKARDVAKLTTEEVKIPLEKKKGSSFRLLRGRKFPVGTDAVNILEKAVHAMVVHQNSTKDRGGPVSNEYFH